MERFDTNAEGRIDQGEFYEEDALTPLGKDRDYDHRIDHWATYRDGKAATAAFDTNEDGNVDSVWETPGH